MVETGHPRRWWVLGVMCVSLILVVAGISSLNLAIPSIRDALDATNTELLWIFDSYALVFAGLLLPAGALGDRFGRKEALVTGFLIFMGGALAASSSGSAMQLIASRAAMGVGAALIMPATLSIITVVFPPHERAKAIAIWAGFAGAGGAIGVLGGGLLLEAFWWGSVFFINIPLAVIALVAVFAIVPTSRDETRRAFDPVGALLSMAGLTAMLFAIIEGPERGWTSGLVLGSFAAATVLLVGFIRWELQVDAPMLDPRYFRNRFFALGSVAITLSFLAMFGMFFIITQYFQFAQGHSPLAAAVRTLPFAATMVVVAPRSAAVAAKVGARRTVTAGLLISALGMTGLGLVSPGTHYGLVVIAIILIASGLALLMPPSTEAIVSSLPRDKAGVGSAVNDTTREVGGAVGIALLGSLLSVGYRNGLGNVTDGLPAQAAAAAEDSIGAAIQVAGQLGGEVGRALVDAAAQAFTDGMQVSMWVAAGVLVAAAGIVWYFHPDRDAVGTGTVRHETEPTSEVT